MKLLRLYSFLFALLLTCSVDASNSLKKRSTQVSLISYTFSNGVLAGSIKVQNLAYAKVVTVIYAVGSTWSDSQKISAAYSSGPGSDGYETWTFSGSASGATQFYIKYDVNGVSYYDPGNSVNYSIGTTSTTTSTATRCTVTTTTTIRSS